MVIIVVSNKFGCDCNLFAITDQWWQKQLAVILLVFKATQKILD